MLLLCIYVVKSQSIRLLCCCCVYSGERERETSERLRRRKEAGCRSSRVTTASETLKHWWIQSNSIIHLNLSELRIQRLAALRHSRIVQWPCGVYNAVISLYQSLRQDVLCVCKTLLPICTSMASAVCSKANTSSHIHTPPWKTHEGYVCVCVRLSASGRRHSITDTHIRNSRLCWEK